MAITVVGVGAVDSATPFAPTVAGPVLTNDIILILVEQASLTSPEAAIAASGYAHVTGSPVGPDSAATVLGVLWRRSPSGGETSATVTGPSNHGVTRTITLRGVKATGNPWNVSPTFATEANAVDTGATWPTLTTLAAGCFICLCIATGRDFASTTNLGAVTGGTGLTNVTEQMDNWVATGTGGGIGLVTADKAAAGTIGSPVATMGSNDGKALLTLALELEPVAPDRRRVARPSFIPIDHSFRF
jgi:hypothetical protein